MTSPLSPELNEIARLLDMPRPPLLVVVGAGVSIGATGHSHASWLGLLKHGIRYLVQRRFQPQWGKDLETSLDASFSPFNLKTALQHAELVEQALTTPDATAFAEWLETAFSNFKAGDDRGATLEALREVQEAGALLLTTNYDSLLSDITNTPPVTWEQHSDFHRVMTRQQRGVLHIHGHWQRPSSIVLGRSSYDRVVEDEDLQALFKTLWLDWSWLYIGCGDGLDDPNLGRLLEWGKRWGDSAMPDYFLAQDDKAIEIGKRTGKPNNLLSIGYPSHADLPGILHSISPSARSWPFVEINEEFHLFRTPGSNVPFPTRQEYLDGDVPVFDADAQVKQRLQTHGWACIMDLASVGKTTLALRLATDAAQRGKPVYYFDLNFDILDDSGVGADSTLHRLSRPGTLFILDNIHHQTELSRRLWQRWKDNPRESRLLLVATRMQHYALTTPDQDLIFFEQHPTNPAILLQPSSEDLGRLAKHIYQRVGGPSCPPMPDPPSEVLTVWHRDFRAALNAFTFAAMSHLADFQKGDWELPPTAAAFWVRKNWLDKLDAPELENIVCLAAFGAQELEMLVQAGALPYPAKMEKLLKLALVGQTNFGRFGQYRQFGLREAGWGRLIFGALESPRDQEEILFDTAARHPFMALVMSRRLKGEGLADKYQRLWTALASNKKTLAAILLDVPLSHIGQLLREAQDFNQGTLTSFLWQTIETQPDKLAASAWESSLHEVGLFLDVAQQQGRDTMPLWEAIESQPDKLATKAWETSLHSVGFFLDVAQRQRRDIKPLWEAIESQPDKLATKAWETSLHGVGFFLDVAQRQRRDIKPLWEAIESQPDKLAAKAWESLPGVYFFLDVAQRQRRDTTLFWEAIESQPDKLAARAWETSLDMLGSFLDFAHQRGRDTKPLWVAIESQPGKLAARAWETSLEKLGSFLDFAHQRGRDTNPLWKAIEGQPDRLAMKAWETSLESVGSFLDVAQQQGRDTKPLWEAIESQPDRIAAKAWETSLQSVGSFLDVAKQQGRDTKPLWEAIESQPDRFAARAWETSLDSLGSFLDVAQQQGRDTKQLWEAIESQPDKLAAKAWDSPLHGVGGFLETARRHGRETQYLTDALAAEPEALARLARSTDLSNLVGFAHHAPTSLVEIALRGINPGHWNATPVSTGMSGGLWLATNCAKANRYDLASDIIVLLLRRANWRDFPSQAGGFGQVCWLLANVPCSAVELIEPFLKAVCTNSWLQTAYATSKCGSLASGLRQLAVHQSVERCRQFHHRALGERLKKELAQFEKAEPAQQFWIIQLLGCAVLCGWLGGLRRLINIEPEFVQQLVLIGRGHRPEAARVEESQLQFWLGLRAFVSITGRRLPMAEDVIESTLTLWRENLSETSMLEPGAAHRVNQSMVTWLESCLRANPTSLLPSKEPLWTLVGFSLLLDLPTATRVPGAS